MFRWGERDRVRPKSQGVEFGKGQIPRRKRKKEVGREKRLRKYGCDFDTLLHTALRAEGPCWDYEPARL